MLTGSAPSGSLNCSKKSEIKVTLATFPKYTATLISLFRAANLLTPSGFTYTPNNVRSWSSLPSLSVRYP